MIICENYSILFIRVLSAHAVQPRAAGVAQLQRAEGGQLGEAPQPGLKIRNPDDVLI